MVDQPFSRFRILDSIYDSEENELYGGYDPIYISLLEVDGPHLRVVDEARRDYRIDLATRCVEALLERRPYPPVEACDYQVYRAVLQYLSRRHQFQDWLVSDTVTDFDDGGAVLLCRPSDQPPQVLGPDLKTDLGSRSLDARSLADCIAELLDQKSLLRAYQETGNAPAGYLSMTRVRRDPERNLALLTVSGARAGYDLVVKADGSVDEFESTWDYAGAYGLPDRPVSTEEALYGAAEFFESKLEGLLEPPSSRDP